jgi:hypothetical protein
VAAVTKMAHAMVHPVETQHCLNYDRSGQVEQPQSPQVTA